MLIWRSIPLKALNGIQGNLTGSKISMSSTKFVFFGPIGKTRWPPWPLIGWDICDFFSETAEWNSTKLDRRQILNILYQGCVFSGRSEKQDGRPDLWFTEDIFNFSTETAEQNSMKLNRKQDLEILYQVCVFRADRKNKMTALASDWLRHFRLLLWNRLTEFSELDRKENRNVLFQVCVFGSISIPKWLPWSFCQKGGTLYSGARYVVLWASCLWPTLNQRSSYLQDLV